MVFTYAPDFAIIKERDELGDTESITGNGAPLPSAETDVPGWTVLHDEASDEQSVDQPCDMDHDMQPLQTTSELPSRALTVDDFLHWSARTPPAKRYGGRKYRRAKQQSRLHPAPATNASSEHHGVGDNGSRLSDPEKAAPRRRKRRSLATCSVTFAAAALAHAPTTQNPAHTGGRVPLVFVRATERAPQHPARKVGRLVDPRKSVAIALPRSHPSLEISAGVEASRSRHAPRKPITSWMLRGADVKNAVQGRNALYGRATAVSSHAGADRDQVRRGIYPFALVPLAEHEAGLQKKFRRQLQVLADRPAANPGRNTQDREPCPSVSQRAAIATPIPPKPMCLKRFPDIVSASAMQVPSCAIPEPSSCKEESSPNGASSSPHASDRSLMNKPRMHTDPVGNEQCTSVPAADLPLRKSPIKTRTRKSLADRFDCVDPDSRPAPLITSNTASALLPAPTTNDAICSPLSVSALDHTSSGTTAGISVTGTGLRVESSIRLRPLASYMDSFRETARAATIQQMSAIQTRGTASDARQSEKTCRSSRNDASSAAPRAVGLQTTLHRYAHGASDPYDGASRDPTSRRAMRPGSAYATWTRNRRDPLGPEEGCSANEQYLDG